MEIAVIFDLDGVIVNTSIYHYKAWRQIAKELGSDFTLEQNEALKGVSRTQSLEILLKTIGQEHLFSNNFKMKQLAEQKNAYYLSRIESITQEDILPGVIRFINLLKNEGIKIALASSSHNVDIVLSRLGIASLFDAIVDGSMVEETKPHPALFLKAAELIGVEPCNCVVFEDAVSGIEAAHRAGMVAIGVGSSSQLKRIANKSILSFRKTNLAIFNHIKPNFSSGQINTWAITEEVFNPKESLKNESLFSIGNGTMGGRGSFEEQYSGDSLSGNYIGGIYYPDSTRVSWWKNGYPDYYAKMVNAINWIGINLEINGESIDLKKTAHKDFERTLNMRRGVLERRFVVCLNRGCELQIESTRFCSMQNKELAALQYKIKLIKGNMATISLSAYADGSMRNSDSYYNEDFKENIECQNGTMTMAIRKSGFLIACHIKNSFTHNDTIQLDLQEQSAQKQLRESGSVTITKGETVSLTKFAAITTSLNHTSEELSLAAENIATEAAQKGFNVILKEHSQTWANIWNEVDVEIDGSPATQQAMRFAIFQLLQTFDGSDSRLNVGPKGFTGEKYGGSTYWDTEAFCFAFYMAYKPEIAEKLLEYRYKQLPQAIENAKKLGIKNRAALYPMVTVDGKESHNEWEITFEEIHRNGAISHAIYKYMTHTNSTDYLAKGGLAVLVSIARYWQRRLSYSENKKAYVLLGVTGPNEYENNVNNNFYTLYLAKWCMEYAAKCVSTLSKTNPKAFEEVRNEISLGTTSEPVKWRKIAKNIYIPFDESRKIYLQQDGYLDKELIKASQLLERDRPLNKHWSWDTILRSCFIKQADVLQTFFMFKNNFTIEDQRRNFDFYEPYTVHESSLSPSVHAMVAAHIGYRDKSDEMLQRALRLDLDDINHEIDEGLHITGMGGTWQAVVEGMAGVYVEDGVLFIAPNIPNGWSKLSFKIWAAKARVKITITQFSTEVTLLKGKSIKLSIKGTSKTLNTSKPTVIV